LIPWVLAGVALLAFGYFKFIHEPAPKQRARAPTATPAPTATMMMTEDESVSGGFFSSNAEPSGFLPTASASDEQSPTTVTITPTVAPVVTDTKPLDAPVATQTPTSAPDTIEYAVYIGDAFDLVSITCRCTPSGSIEGPVECTTAIPMACRKDRGGNDG